MDKRTIIAVVLSVAILFAWQYFFSPKMSEQQKPQAGAPQGQVQGGAPAQPSQAGAKGPQIAPVQVPGQAPAAGAQAPAAGQPVPAAQPPIPGVQAAAEPKAAAQSKPARKITVETPTMTVTLTDIGEASRTCASRNTRKPWTARKARSHPEYSAVPLSPHRLDDSRRPGWGRRRRLHPGPGRLHR